MSHPFSNHFPPKPHRDVSGGENGEMVDILVLTTVVAQMPCIQHRIFDINFFYWFECSFCQNFMVIVNLLTFLGGFDFLVMSHVASEESVRW